MSKKSIFSENAPKPVGSYSQAIKVENIVYCSGQIAIDPKTNEMIPNSNFESETKQIMKNLISVLEEAGSNIHNIIRTTIYITDIDQFSKVNEIYSTFFENSIKPARACVEVSSLPKDRDLTTGTDKTSTND